jgi:hypothetical protein
VRRAQIAYQMIKRFLRHFIRHRSPPSQLMNDECGTTSDEGAAV